MAPEAPAVAVDSARILLCGLVLSSSVGIALARPRLRIVGRTGPAHAAVLAVAAVLLTGMAAPAELLRAYGDLVRPLSAIAGIMVMAACVHRSGLLTALATRFLFRPRRALGTTLGAVFVLAAATSSVLNNDAMILLLTPLVLRLARQGWPDSPRAHRLLAYAVFAAIGVAPVVIANPINLLVADQAGIRFNAYLLHMIPAAGIGWLATWLVLVAVFRRHLGREREGPVGEGPLRLTGRQRRTAIVLAGVVLAYPVASTMHEWAVAVVSVAGGLVLMRVVRAPARTVLRREVEWGILVFMLGAFAIGIALQNAGAVDALARLYHRGGALALGGLSAAGSAVLNNHPMTILNLLALQAPPASPDVSYLIALAGGDIGPRLLPTGSLAGLLWLADCRRANVEIPLRWFVGLGVATLVPALIGSVAVLLWLNG